MGIEERIDVVGGDKARQQLDQVADAGKRVADAAQDTGDKAGKAGSMMDGLGAAAARTVSSYFGFSAVIQLFQQFRQMLEDVVRLQKELADGSVTLSDSSKSLAEQLKLDEAGGVRVLTDLAITGGADAAAANEFGIAADISFAKAGLGGLLTGGNMGLAKHIFTFAGSKNFTGGESAALVKLLGMIGALGSQEEADAAIAQLSAAAAASDATSTGAYVAQTLRGSTGIIQKGIPFTDTLSINAKARSVEVNEELAAQTVATLEQVAIGLAEDGFNKLLGGRLRESGLTLKGSSDAQRVQATLDIFQGMTSPESFDRVRQSMSPERFLRLSKAFGPENVAATAPVDAAIRTASPFDVAMEIEQGRNEMPFRDRQNKAAQAFEAWQVGVETFTISQARKRADALLDAQIARGIVQVLPGGREAESERIVLGLLASQMESLAREGADVSGVQSAIDDVGKWRPGVLGGYSDERLANIAGELDRARWRSSANRQAALRGQRDAAGAGVQVYNIGTQYNDRDPLNDPQPRVDRGD